MDLLRHLRLESDRFADVLRDVAPETRVPTCPEWTADDLLWHLGEVQWMWGSVVREHATPQDLTRPDRPADRAGLLAFFEDASRELSTVLAAHPVDEATWTWSDDHTVRFVVRRQAHEALIHRVDAELTAGISSPMDTPLCVDGVDETLRVMYGALPAWATFTAEPAKTVRLRAADTGDTWFLTLGRFAGTAPDGGRSYDDPDFEVASADPGGDAAAELSATVADLDRWLWHRPAEGEVRRAGDEDVLRYFEAAIAEGIR
ncbi:MAG TPA: maleylpyruvate isomerase family mycothiol-dependent enzyme [Pseudonocardiaceae bacterium]|nr:maleylpyruvate isomerase family mycothiol-dependent enzyme [Pseudonocardiaceae bacterium]